MHCTPILIKQADELHPRLLWKQMSRWPMATSMARSDLYCSSGHPKCRKTYKKEVLSPLWSFHCLDWPSDDPFGRASGEQLEAAPGLVQMVCLIH